MTLDIQPARPDETVTEVLDRMADFYISDIPLIDQDCHYQFMINEYELMDVLEPAQKIGEINLSGASRRYCKELQHHMEILKNFAAHKTSCLPVVDNKNRYTGLITTTDFLYRLASDSALISPGAVIVLEINSNDYALSEIARIAESNDCKILSLDIHNSPDSKKLEVSIKLHQEEVGPIIQTFNRFGYKLLAAYTESDYQQDLKERYDSLMKYLEL